MLSMKVRPDFLKFYQITAVVLILLPFLILGWLIKKDLVISGRLSLVYDFSHESPLITDLFPAKRLTEIKRLSESEFSQSLLGEPVYFETRVPQNFKAATVEMIYQNQAVPLVQIGLRVIGKGDWNYYFQPFGASSTVDALAIDYRLPQLEDGWQAGQARFDLTNAEILNRKLRFAISAPGLKPSDNQSLIIKKIKVTLIKEPLTWPEFVRQFKDYFKTRFHAI